MELVSHEQAHGARVPLLRLLQAVARCYPAKLPQTKTVSISTTRLLFASTAIVGIITSSFLVCLVAITPPSVTLAAAEPQYMPGVKSGDYVTYKMNVYETSGTSGGGRRIPQTSSPNAPVIAHIQSVKMTVDKIDGSLATVSIEGGPTQMGSADVLSGPSVQSPLSGFPYPNRYMTATGLSAGSPLGSTGYDAAVTVNGTVTGQYAGATRTVNVVHLTYNFSFRIHLITNPQSSYYSYSWEFSPTDMLANTWNFTYKQVSVIGETFIYTDQLTGILLGLHDIQPSYAADMMGPSFPNQDFPPGMTETGVKYSETVMEATETNMWQPEPSSLLSDNLVLAVVAIALVLVGTVTVIIVRGRRKANAAK